MGPPSLWPNLYKLKLFCFLFYPPFWLWCRHLICNLPINELTLDIDSTASDAKKWWVQQKWQQLHPFSRCRGWQCWQQHPLSDTHAVRDINMASGVQKGRRWHIAESVLLHDLGIFSWLFALSNDSLGFTKAFKIDLSSREIILCCLHQWTLTSNKNSELGTCQF